MAHLNGRTCEWQNLHGDQPGCGTITPTNKHQPAGPKMSPTTSPTKEAHIPDFMLPLDVATTNIHNHPLLVQLRRDMPDLPNTELHDMWTVLGTDRFHLNQQCAHHDAQPHTSRPTAPTKKVQRTLADTAGWICTEYRCLNELDDQDPEFTQQLSAMFDITDCVRMFTQDLISLQHHLHNPTPQSTRDAPGMWEDILVRADTLLYDFPNEGTAGLTPQVAEAGSNVVTSILTDLEQIRRQLHSQHTPRLQTAAAAADLLTPEHREQTLDGRNTVLHEQQQLARHTDIRPAHLHAGHQTLVRRYLQLLTIHNLHDPAITDELYGTFRDRHLPNDTPQQQTEDLNRTIRQLQHQWNTHVEQHARQLAAHPPRLLYVPNPWQHSRWLLQVPVRQQTRRNSLLIVDATTSQHLHRSNIIDCGPIPAELQNPDSRNDILDAASRTYDGDVLSTEIVRHVQAIAHAHTP